MSHRNRPILYQTRQRRSGTYEPAKLVWNMLDAMSVSSTPPTLTDDPKFQFVSKEFGQNV